MTMSESEILDKIDDTKARKRAAERELSVFDESIITANIYSDRLTVAKLRSGWKRVKAAKKLREPFQKNVEQISIDIFRLKAELNRVTNLKKYLRSRK